MNKKKTKQYEAPYTKRSRVELEDCICAGSEIKIEQKNSNVEVDDYASVENDVTFK